MDTQCQMSGIEYGHTASKDASRSMDERCMAVDN